MDLTLASTPRTVSLPRDLGTWPEVGAELWWVSSRLEGAGRLFGVHYCVIHVRTPEPGVLGWVSVLDESTGVHAHDMFQIPLADATIGEPGTLEVRVPSATFTGDLDEMALSVGVGDAQADLTLRPVRPVLFGCGVGTYPLFDSMTSQYSMPAMETSGTIVVGGDSFAVQGTSWYDRQSFFDGLPTGPIVWFGLTLDGGETLSIFDTSPDGPCWVTATSADGSHLVAGVPPLAPVASGEVTNPQTGRTYPERWTVAIPSLEAELVLVQRPLNENPALYTGSVEVSGTYAGRAVTGEGWLDIPGAGGS